jgi:hypothetical protein
MRTMIEWPGVLRPGKWLAARAYGIAVPRPGAPWTGIVHEGPAPVAS